MFGSRISCVRRLSATTATLVVFGIVACENPQPPAACGAIQQVTVNAGEASTVAACFNDPNGGMLSYSATSSNPLVAAASISGTTVRVTAVAPGNASVTVTATDAGGLQGQQSFQVIVPNRPPLPRGTIPPMTVRAGERETVDASSYFTEPDGETLAFGAASSNPAAATVSVAGSTVTVAAVARGTATVTVTATDPGGLQTTQTFQASVPNRRPEVVGTLPAQMLAPGGAAALDASRYFADPDGDTLTYGAASSDPETADVSVDGESVEVLGVGRGEATVTVTATDPYGLAARSSFSVSVTGPENGVQIDLVFVTDITASQEEVFRDAAERWMSILAKTELTDVTVEGSLSCIYYEHSPGTIDDLMILAAVEEFDGPGGILGAAAPCYVREENGLPLFGAMLFDVADVERMEVDGTLGPVILHEMGHVLGIGSLWQYQGLLRNPSSGYGHEDTHFVGPLAIEAFDSAGGVGYVDGAKVPVENFGGQGTRNSHWRASVFGDELMVGWVNKSMPISAITIQSLADLGYTVDASSADAYRLPDSWALESMFENAIYLGNDVISSPITIVDRGGRIVRVIHPS